MKITHDRLPKDVSPVYFENLATKFLTAIFEAEGIDPATTYTHFGKCDTRGLPRIQVTVNHVCPTFNRGKINGWHGFTNMRELIAYLEGFCDAL